MSARVIGQFYGWSEPDSITFLLEGKAPAVDSLRVETGRTINVDGQLAQAWITVRAMPHVRPEEVTAAFREAQGELNSRVRKPIMPRSLALLEFVAGETSHGATHDWPRLRKRVNTWELGANLYR